VVIRLFKCKNLESSEGTKDVRRLIWFLSTFLLCVLIQQGSVSLSPGQERVDVDPRLNDVQLGSIAEVALEAIRLGDIPGAVVLVGNKGKVVYRQAFGDRSLVPEKLPMTADTIFDLASLTKVVATTTALMQLVEKGRLRIEDPVSKYWPEFKGNGKERITVRHLLTHYSGLRDFNPNHKRSGYDSALKTIAAGKPISPPGTRFQYCDVNFIILGEIIQRVSGQPLDAYCDEFIFKPLEMKDTGFKPSFSLRNRIAPTQYTQGNSGKILWGEVHDSVSQSMGGVAGHAGLFSTADDLSIFCQTILDGGISRGVRILSPLTVEKMTTPQSPANMGILRGFGWDIDSPFSSCRGELFPIGSFGHTGFTGTSIWIDPISRTYVILLTHRIHPDGKGDAVPLRSQIATIVAAELGFVRTAQISQGLHSPSGPYEPMKSYRGQELRNGVVETGITVLQKERYAPLSGLRVGVITNHSGLDAEGRHTLDLLAGAPGVKLLSVFVPEHGLSGQMEGKIPSNSNFKKGVPLYSLYGDINRPTDKMLDGLDALVFDIQDAGVRFYTYITTMGYAMEAAAKKGIAFYVLDRPNLLTASTVQGPMMEWDLKSFTGYFPLPVRHGMTVGELAQMFNAENKIGVKLHVVKMKGYRRTDWYDETGLQWTNPSPNLRTLTQATLYPGVAMVEAANVSVGRGTGTPFELLGAPWINGRNLAAYLNKRNIQGVRFLPVEFVPNSDRFKNERCPGVQIILVDRQALDAAALGVELACALYQLHPANFQIDKTVSMIGSRAVLEAIKEGQSPDSIIQGWQPALEEFLELRSKYVLY
jgi:uncharacterized protein YbbC (DUF1343 family)/CubicO group peptidase (beta-lactamase class C family)